MSSGIASRHALLGLALWLGLALPATRAALESRLLTQMLAQLPALVLAGYLVGIAIRDLISRWLAPWDWQGATGLAVALPAAAFWMLPRWIDASLGSAAVETAKFLSVPLLIGLPLALSRPRLGPMTAGFLKANFVSMALFLGWLYSAAPVRLCNSYLIGDQSMLGASWLVIAGLSALLWSVPLFIGRPRDHSDRLMARDAPASDRE